MRFLYHHRIRSRDGQFVHVDEIVGALRRQGHEIIVVGPEIVDNATDYIGAGWVARFKKKAPAALYELVEFAYSFYDLFRLSLAIRRHRPDVIYERYNLFFLSGVWVKRWFRLPLLMEVNAPLARERAEYGGLSLQRFANWAEGYAWCNADRVFPVTHVLGRTLEEKGVSPDRIEVVTNGVRTEIFSGALKRHVDDSADAGGNVITVGFVGYLRGWHRLDRVISLLARKRNIHTRFVVVGDGPARAELEAQASESGVADRVRFVGVKGHDDLPQYVSCFDIALQPSVVDYASPLKLQEYMAMGCAIVAPDKENIREVLIDGENAILFDPADDDSFEEAVQRLCSDDDLRSNTGQRAAQTILDKGLTWDRNAARIVEAADRLLRND